MIGDIIWSYFQDRFGYTHYLIFTGDNGSGKNSALLVFKYLGYRVFYVVSASAPNYWTAYGSQEEGQVSIAEDEADDIGEDKKKNDLLKAGYQSGGRCLSPRFLIIAFLGNPAFSAGSFRFIEKHLLYPLQPDV